MPSYFPFIEPDFSEKRAVRPTFVNTLGQHVMATRKEMEGYGTIVYTYGKLTTRQYRIIDNMFRTVDGRVTSLYVIDWGDPRIVSAIDSKGYVTVNNINGLSAESGDGGNRILLWKNTVEQAYGNDSTVSGNRLTDTKQAWSTNQWQYHQLMDTNGTEAAVSSNAAQTIDLNASVVSGAYDIYRYEEFTISAISGRQLNLNASPVMTYSAMEEFVWPVYESYFLGDSLSGLSQTGEWNKEPNDNYGPFWAGTVEFMQKGTGV